MRLTKKRLLLVWISSGAMVTVARVSNAVDLGELPIQIQAAQHLVAGQGLTVYSAAGELDLAAPAKLLVLAHYPAGFSVYAAVALACGLGLGTLVRIFFGLTTLFGWWGWGNLAHYFFEDGLLRRRGAWHWAAAVVAFCTPLQYTLLWKGTDVLLWAAIPWVVCWITPPAESSPSRGRSRDACAGSLCGFTFVMRYAAVFLAIYAIAVIVCQSRRQGALLGRRLGAFGAGLLPFLLPQIYLTFFSHSSEPIPDIVTFQGGVTTILQRLGHGLPFSTSANVGAAWWMPHPVLDALTRPGTGAVWLAVVTLLGWMMVPVLLARKLGLTTITAASRDVRTVAAGLVGTLPLFLLLWTGLAEYLYVLEDRYYLPLLPLSLLIAYQLAVPDRQLKVAVEKWLGRASLLYLVGYLCIAVISVVRLVVPGEIGLRSRAKLLALPPEKIHWPSIKLGYAFSAGRSYVVSLLRQNPGTVLVTNHEEWFYAEDTIDQSRIRRLKDLAAMYVTGPAHILIAIQDAAPGSLTEVAWYGHYDRRWTADYFANLADIRLLKMFPNEKIRVVEATLPEGARIPLKKETAQVRNVSGVEVNGVSSANESR